MGEVFVITSGKGGVGKTTSTANIGAGLAAADKKTVLIDTDIGLRNLDVVMGLENRIGLPSGRYHRGWMSDQAGTDQGQTLSQSVSSAVSADKR